MIFFSRCGIRKQMITKINIVFIFRKRRKKNVQEIRYIELKRLYMSLFTQPGMNQKLLDNHHHHLHQLHKVTVAAQLFFIFYFFLLLSFSSLNSNTYINFIVFLIGGTYLTKLANPAAGVCSPSSSLWSDIYFLY